MKRAIYTLIFAYCVLWPMMTNAQYYFPPAQVDPNLANALISSMNARYDIGAENRASSVHLNCASHKKINSARLVSTSTGIISYMALLFRDNTNIDIRLRFYSKNGALVTDSGAYTLTMSDNNIVVKRNFVPHKDNTDEYLYYLETEGSKQCFPVVSATVNSNNGAPSYQNGSSGSSSGRKTVPCSLCNGKGWIAGTKNPTYGSGGTHYCYECQRNVPASHSHDQCPSCGGKGTITKIR